MHEWIQSRHPDLTIDLVLADHQLDLIGEQIDVAIRFGGRPDGDFVARQLVPRHFHVCASPDYTHRHGHPGHPQALADRDCLLFSLPGYRSAWKFRMPGDEPFTVPVGGHLLVSHGETMTACAAAGLGPALLPDWLCREEIESGTLIDLFPDYECTATEFDTSAWLIYPGHTDLPLKTRVFVDFLRAEVNGCA